MSAAEAVTAARLLARDPQGLGGLWLRGFDDAARDTVLDALRDGLPAGAAMRRLPVHADDEALVGGIDLAATLGIGRSVARRGLLAEAEGGAVIVNMAERLSDAAAGRIAAAMDGGAGFALILFDDGLTDERPPSVVTERVAFHLSCAA